MRGSTPLKVTFYLFLFLVFSLTTTFAQGPTASEADEPESPRQLKRDAISKLEQISSTNKKLQKIIDGAIDDISRSLTDKGRELFLDGSRILPPPDGKKVFDQEKRAVNQLLKGVRHDEDDDNHGTDVPDEVQAIFQEVIDNLVKADRAIAELSITTAEHLVRAGQGNEKKLASARREFERAIQEPDPKKAIDRFKKAWEFSQEVVGDQKLVISAFDDTPDPFSPSLTANTLTLTFQILRDSHAKGEDDEDDRDDKKDKKGKDGEDKRNSKEFVLELVEIVQDSGGATVQTVTTRQDVVVPSQGAEVTLASMWDGLKGEGGLVADGMYSYLAFGKLITPKSRRDDDDDHGRDDGKEKVWATSFPILGTVLLDNTPPDITATLAPQPKENGWNNSDVTVSFAAADGLSGVAEVSPDVIVTEEGAGQLVTGSTTEVVPKN